MSSHLDMELSGLQVIENDYGGNSFKNEQKKNVKAKSRAPIQSNSAHGNYQDDPQIVLQDHTRKKRAGYESVQEIHTDSAAKSKSALQPTNIGDSRSQFDNQLSEPSSKMG